MEDEKPRVKLVPLQGSDAWWQVIDRAAKASHRCRREFVREALRSYIETFRKENPYHANKLRQLS